MAIEREINIGKYIIDIGDNNALGDADDKVYSEDAKGKKISSPLQGTAKEDALVQFRQWLGITKPNQKIVASQVREYAHFIHSAEASIKSEDYLSAEAALDKAEVAATKSGFLDGASPRITKMRRRVIEIRIKISTQKDEQAIPFMRKAPTKIDHLETTWNFIRASAEALPKSKEIEKAKMDISLGLPPEEIVDVQRIIRAFSLAKNGLLMRAYSVFFKLAEKAIQGRSKDDALNAYHKLEEFKRYVTDCGTYIDEDTGREINGMLTRLHQINSDVSLSENNPNIPSLK